MPSFPRTNVRTEAARDRGAMLVRAGLLFLPLLGGVILVRSCSSPEAPPASEAPPPAPAAETPAPNVFGDDDGSSGGSGGGVLSESDELVVLRRTLGSLSVEDESRLLAVLEKDRVSPGNSDPARATRFAHHLGALMRDEAPPIRRAAVALYGRMSPGDAPDVSLVSALGDDDPCVRAEAVRSLALRGPAERVDRFVSQATDTDPGVRRAVATALGRVQTPESRRTLLVLLQDQDGEVVRATGESLARTLQDLPPEVASAAASERAIVRIAATRAISALGAKESLPLLRKLSDDAVWEVRRDAIRGLGVLGEPHAAVAKEVLEGIARAAERPRTDRFEAIQAMASMPLAPDADALAPIARADADQVIRMMAARTLLARGDVRGLGVLTDLLGVEIGPRTDDEDRIFIRKTSAETLTAVAGEPPGDGSQSAWKAALPEIEARLTASGFEYAPERLVEFW